MHSQSQLAAVEWDKAFKWSQKIQCTEKGVRSLENLYGVHSYLNMQQISGIRGSARKAAPQDNLFKDKKLA